jgi:primosomal protein N' (replication factor Y)
LSGNAEYATVAIPVGVHEAFTYAIPAEMRDHVRLGTRVEVPLGTKRVTGFVVGLNGKAPEGFAVKPIRGVLDSGDSALIPEIVELCRWAAEYYIAPLGLMLKVALPSNMAARAKPGDELRDAVGVRYDRWAIWTAEGGCPPLTAKQQAIVDQLKNGPQPVAALNGSDGVIATLAKKNVIRIERRARKHTLDAFLSGHEAVEEFRYSKEQQHAIDAIKKSFGTFAPFLLEGVTGSGKTEVYIEVMREVVRRGEQAILLVPEISLTPVFAARLKQRFGERIAILHSNLSASERYDQWWRAHRGEVDVAIGPRSALFTPFQKLGVIVVDEEGDGAYKQDETPRYNARDLAVVRAQIRKIPVILGSATPSLESRENAQRGKYTLLQMKSRVEARPLPDADVIDLRNERGEKEDRGFVIFSAPLKEAMQTTFAAGEQSMILINRRGYAPYLLCRECGHDFRCRDCSVTMTVHRRAGLLICHYCGLRSKIAEKCPICQGEVLQPVGFGTEKVEERFRRDFPGIEVDVLDRDSTRKRGELVRILDRFRTGKTQALIGTQMLSKGHHFPDVTLTAVLNADSILGYPDFRSAEKTFYLLTQVAGRAGRGERRGRVLIQTAFPTHYAIQHALRHDYEEFYKSEIEFRQTFHYPPATSMIAILFRGENVTFVERAAGEAGRKLEKAIEPLAGTRMQGPAPAPLSRIKGVYRYQILLRSAQRTALRRAVEAVMIGRKWSGVDWAIDVDPLNIL